MSDSLPAWVSVVTAPHAPGEPWRALVVRLTPHADAQPGPHWWSLVPVDRPHDGTGVRRFLDDDGEVCAMEILAESREDFADILGRARLPFDSLGSPTLFHMPSEHTRADGWVWPFPEGLAGLGMNHHDDHCLVLDIQWPDGETYRHPVVYANAGHVTLCGGEAVSPDLGHRGFYCLDCGRHLEDAEAGVESGYELDWVVD